MFSEVRVLVVEDEPEEAREIEKTCRSAENDAAIVEVTNNASRAIELLGNGHFDLAILDLKIPLDQHRFAADKENGLNVVRSAQSQQPGLPLIVLSEHAFDSDVSKRFIRQADKRDPYALGEAFSMLTPFPKESLVECQEAIKTSISRSATVAAVSLEGSGSALLNVGEARAVQLLTLDAGGISGHIEVLEGGQSGAKVVRVRVIDIDGAGVGHVVTKIGDHQRLALEREGYKQASMALPVSLVTPMPKAIEAGAGGLAAVSYADLARHDRNLFNVITSDPQDGAEVARRLRSHFQERNGDAAPKNYELRSLRREIIRYNDLSDAGDLASRIEALDDCAISGTKRLQHGDMHGENVLVDADMAPRLIDYADVKWCTPALDPMTLELSLALHPKAQQARGDWPTADEMSQWFDTDRYLARCPASDFILTCRDWANTEAGPAEVAAVGLSYAVRQLRYRDVDADVAGALAEAALTRLESVLPE